jgi:hypothetical protein
MPQLPDNDWHYKKWYANVRSDEITRIPVSLQKHRESCNQSDDSGPNEPIPCGKRLERALPRQAVSAVSLCFHGSIEADEAET